MLLFFGLSLQEMPDPFNLAPPATQWGLLAYCAHQAVIYNLGQVRRHGKSRESFALPLALHTVHRYTVTPLHRYTVTRESLALPLAPRRVQRVTPRHHCTVTPFHRHTVPPSHRYTVTPSHRHTAVTCCYNATPPHRYLLLHRYMLLHTLRAADAQLQPTRCDIGHRRFPRGVGHHRQAARHSACAATSRLHGADAPDPGGVPKLFERARQSRWRRCGGVIQCGRRRENGP